MSVALVLVEHDNGEVKDATLAAVTAAAKLGEVHLLVAGEGVGGVADAAAKIAGAVKVHVADDAAYGHNLAENVAPVAADLVRDHCDYFVAPATTTGKNIAPRVAALLDVMQISDILSVESADTFTRPIYAGNAIATVESADAKLVITVRGTAFAKADPTSGSGTVEAVSGTGDRGLSSFVGAELSKSERPELTSAKIIVSGGRALKDGPTFEATIFPLADKLGAAVGASRAAVDAGYVPNDYQVGQTGKIVAPEVYIAIGISGAIQHLAVAALGRLEETIAARAANFDLLDALLDDIPGVRPPARPSHMTRPVHYSYQPRYVPEELDGLPIEVFTKAVAAEGVPLTRPKSPPLHCLPAFARTDLGMRTYGHFGHQGATYRTYAPGDLPASEAYVAHALRLPAYTDDVRPYVERVAAAFAKVARNAATLHNSIETIERDLKASVQ